MSSSPDFNLSLSERAFAAAGAGFLSVVIVNPLDVAKTRLQAQAAGVPYQNLHSKCRFEPNTGSIFEVAVFPNRIQGFNFLNSSSLLFYCYTKLQIFVLKCCDVGEDIKKFKWLFYCYLPFYH
uniref:Uncharacterized protein n=1 Tax=Lactuca sativa TaxID=4236 RepID=A0A9R1XX65_LACSA|nr:hypothetical protein LSAT_V11C100038540 [Lactuca sativa]